MNVPLRKIEKPVRPEADRPGQATATIAALNVGATGAAYSAPRILDRLAGPILAITGLATIAWMVWLGWGVVWLLAHVLF